MDIFLYAGELRMLEARVRTLADLDVEPVAVIANRTHQGDLIDSMVIDHWAWCAEDFGCEVFFVDLSDFDGSPRGGAGRPGYQVRERAHRDRAVEQLDGAAELLMLSDVDEIPRPARLAPVLAEDIPYGHVLCFAQRMHPWAARWLYPGPWLGTTITRAESVAGAEGFQWMRDVRGTERCRVLGADSPDVYPDGGWHLSWWGDADARVRKLQSFSHYELAHKEAELEQLADTGVDINGVQLVDVDPDELDWPEGMP